jgi:hypothetical protein
MNRFGNPGSVFHGLRECSVQFLDCLDGLLAHCADCLIIVNSAAEMGSANFAKAVDRLAGLVH